MGRLKAFGKAPKRQASEGSGALGASATADNASQATVSLAVKCQARQKLLTFVQEHSPSILPKTPLQVLLASSPNPPMSNEAPTVAIPSHTAILISEESASGWVTIYRGQAASTGHDARLLEEVMPFWLLEYLLINKIPPIPTVKVSFVLLPCRSKDPSEEQLPELLNTCVYSFETSVQY